MHYSELEKKYHKRTEQYNLVSKNLTKKIIQSGWLRIIVFTALIIAPVYFNKYSTTIALFTFLIIAVLFGILIKRFNKLKKERTEANLLAELNQKELKAILGDWDSFNSGEQFIDPSHSYSHDLDIFGRGSFFQYINRSATLGGELRLKKELTNPMLDAKDIELRQEALKEVSKNIDFRQQFYTKGKLLQETEEDIHKLKQINQYKPILYHKVKLYRLITILLPALFLVSCILTFYGLNASISTIIFLLNIAVVGSKFKELNKTNIVFTSLSSLLKKYAILTELICDQEFHIQNLNTLKNDVYLNQQKASEIIKKLSHYMNQFDQRNSIIAGFLLNGAFLWDYIYVLKIENWLNTYKEQMHKWISTVHEMDVMQSMAGYVYNHPDYIFPVFSDNTILAVTEIGHPLLDRKERITNNFDYEDSIFTLITGANMSGKSTFLRTIGLNIVIARCGMSVCAQKMTLKPMDLITNMRTSDSLYKHESYFYAELKRLQMIINKLKEGNDLFIILDEILKGTNSRDKTYGSMELIRRLLSLNGTGMIATHDLELGILEKETHGKITNHCFEVEHKENNLIFDYKLRKGITQNHNATFLMKQMNIIDS